MRPERLLPLTLVVVGAVVFYWAYQKKSAPVDVPAGFEGNQAIVLFYRHDCVTCHTVNSLPNSRGVLGPGLDHVGDRALEYDPAGKGATYLRESILEPSKVVREGFVNAMPSFRGKLTEEELEILVTWLLTLRKGETSSESGGAS